MSERAKSGWQAWVAGALFLGLIAAALLINRREAPAGPKVAPTPAASASPLRPAPLILPEPPVDREGLIQAAATAADAFASGAAGPSDQAALVGRRFELRLPFGCAGPEPADSQVPLGWRYDEARETLRVFTRPSDWSKAPWMQTVIGGDRELAAEGFAIERPWLFAGHCPKRRAVAASPAAKQDGGSSPRTAVAVSKPAGADDPQLAPPVLGLVQLFGSDAPRSARGERGYNAVVKRPPEAIRAELSFVLVLGGRLAAFPDGQPVACWGEAWTAPPHCLIAASVEHVAILDDSGSEVARWDP